MVISRASEYAIRSMVYMAGFPSDKIVSRQEICKTQDVTPAFLIKIMQPLIAHGLVKSHRGVSGGFSLGKAPEEISMWDIIEAVEGKILLNTCLVHEGFCPRDETCKVHQVWQTAFTGLRDVLQSATLNTLVNQK